MAFTGQITSRTIGVRLSRALNRPSLMKAFIRPSATLKGGRFRLRQAAATRRIVATSEHWWEDEEEFDSVTDALNPKRLLIVSSPADAAAVATLLSSVRFVCGFFGPQVRAT